jgi:endonuclease/exonuclease/phosphatase family metal-dependent hydrolase
MMKTVVRPALFVLPALILSLTAFSQDARECAFRFMFYNTENFFDTLDDSLTEDDEFLPGGVRRWNNGRYLDKLKSVYRTIIAAGAWHPPDIVALCEIENRKVLQDLIDLTNLSKLGYGIVHADSPDERGIDVALLYRKETIRILSSRFSMPSLKGEKITGTRYLLQTSILWGNDTLHIFVNHWPSRRGGVLAGEEVRLAMSDLLGYKIDSISERSSGRTKIIIGGDFNCTPDDPVVTSLVERKESNLVNTCLRPAREGSGTYRFRGTWEMIDQVIVSRFLFDCGEGLFADGKSLRIFRDDFLLKNDPVYPGLTPYSTYRGYRYQGGFSDHLPVLFDLFAR